MVPHKTSISHCLNSFHFLSFTHMYCIMIYDDLCKLIYIYIYTWRQRERYIYIHMRTYIIHYIYMTGSHVLLAPPKAFLRSDPTGIVLPHHRVARCYDAGAMADLSAVLEVLRQRHEADLPPGDTIHQL